MIDVMVCVIRAVDPPVAPEPEPDADRDAPVGAPPLGRAPPPPLRPDVSVAVVVGASGTVVDGVGVVLHGATGAVAMVVVVEVVEVVEVSTGVVPADVSGVESGVASGTVVAVGAVEESAGAVVEVAEQSNKADALFTGRGVDDPAEFAELFDVGVLAELEELEELDGVLELELV